MDKFVAMIYFKDKNDLDILAREFSFWEINKEGGYVISMIRGDQYDSLLSLDYKVEIDKDRTELLRKGIY